MILTLTMRGTTMGDLPTSALNRAIDVYDLDTVDLSDVRGIVVTAGCDQRYLASRRELLDAWVRDGGRLLANGLPVLPYVTGLPQVRQLDFHGLDDLWLTATGDHPLWTGIDRRDLLLRAGDNDPHTFDELTSVAVAGFYAHAYLTRLPAGAVTITGIGPGRLPVDVSYPLGHGEVIVHCGNDLAGFANPHTSTAGLAERIDRYLEQATPGNLAQDQPDSATGTFPPRARIAFVHSGSSFHLADLADPAVVARNLVEVYAPEMTADSLDRVDGLYLAARQHPGTLRRIVPHVLAFLQRPGVKVFIDGENAVGTWLPGTTAEKRGTAFWAWRTGEDLGRRSVNRDHPLWSQRYLTDDAVHWHYHGVLAPPASATPLVVLEPVPGADPDSRDPWGEPYRALPGHPNVLLYHDARTFPAEVVVSTMDATYHHGAGFMPGATQLFYRMLDWLTTASPSAPA
jgi:hypothetical protein